MLLVGVDEGLLLSLPPHAVNEIAASKEIRANFDVFFMFNTVLLLELIELYHFLKSNYSF